ncbi:MAG: O-antigen ligase family protein, partial [Candidatus Binatia bacterium]
LIDRSMRFDTSISAPGGESLQERIGQHEAALRIFLQHPLLGVGMGNFEPIATYQFRVRNTLHNSFLLALIEGGPIVLGLHLWLFVIVWRQLRRLERDRTADLAWLARGLRYSFILFLVASATADIWLSEMLYVIFGLTIALAALPPAPSNERRTP